ncbi:hypothetical protein [Flavobacterium psychrotrophum]|uniref:hypothetical protein n=1 Tax=Flavobacterium psychrotrophum TaxID=2294119 RepID=UPI000E3140B6|nr:hypothetical protein [Flavobacterium psychrotrophum]
MSNRATRRKVERNLTSRQTRIPSEKLLSDLKYSFDDTEKQYKILNTVSNARFTQINGESLPKSYADIGKGGQTYFNDDLTKEINWYAYVIERYSDQVNNFLSLENQVYSNILKSEYVEAKLLIEKIESDICYSQWSIEQKLIVAEYENGFKKNKEILSNTVSSKNQGVTNVFAKYQSIRIEKNLSFFAFEEIIEPFIQLHSDLLQNLLNYRLNYFKHFHQGNFGFILAYFNGYSIIDKYILFINIILNVVSHRELDEKLMNTIKDAVLKLNKKINDPRLTNILVALGITEKINLSNYNLKYLEVLDLYTEGSYFEASEKAKSLLTVAPLFFEIYEVYIKSLINLDLPFDNFFKENSIANQTLSDLNNIITKNSNYEESIANAYKTYNSIGLNPWTTKYFYYFNSEHSTIGEFIDIQKLSILSSDYCNPAMTTFLKEDSENFLNKLDEIYPNSQVVLFWKRISAKLVSDSEIVYENYKVASFREAFYNIKIEEVKGNYERAFEEYCALEKNTSLQYEVNLIHNKEEIIFSKLRCLLNLDRYSEAVNLTVENILANKNLKNRLFSNFLLNKIRSEDHNELYFDIATSIYLNEYSILLNENDLWIAYDEFMCNQDLKLPRELEKNKQDFKSEQLIYFLRYICRQEVYDSSPSFESQDELDNERVEVCRLLSEIDRNNFEDYINEIAEINRNQLIRKGIKQIDESKIYVDVNGIRTSLDKDIRESFERSLNLLNLPLDQIKKIDENTETILIPYYSKNTENKADSISNMKITSYSRLTQFIDMFSKIRDKFIASNEFGIDTYLSMRIRHGTLLGEIRSVFELYNLVTKKEDSSNNYQENTYWKEKLHLKPALNEIFNSKMADFSSEIDTICSDLKNKKIQIRTEKKNTEGLFDYAFTENEFWQIFSYQIGAIDNYEEFFDTVISILWERTEKILYNIREHISSVVKAKMIKNLSDLARNLESNLERNEYPELNEIISSITACQTEISNELDKISSWFKRSNSKTINEFEIDLPINASITILKRIFKDYGNLIPKIAIECPTRFEGEYFPHFTYIMQNLFHNILNHSKLNPRELYISISAKLEENILTIEVENNFSDKLDLEEMNSKIAETKKLMLQNHDNEKTRAEDGTGYIKIRKTLVIDLYRKDYMIDIFEVDEKRIFKTKIKFNIDNLQKNDYEHISY